MRFTEIGFFLFLILTFSFHLLQAQRQVHFGNGLRNSWADQHSIVIWSRLTSQSEMSRIGKSFIPLASEDGRELKKVSDENKILAAQLPPGAVLHQMKGACPGALGEIRLSYWPKNKPKQKTTIAWQAVDASKNFTTQWKLENLQAGTEYQLLLDGRPNEKTATTARLEGAFKTAPSKEMDVDVVFCAVSCHDYRSIDDSLGGHRLYQTLLSLKPDFFVHTGDVEYYDRGVPMALTESLARFKWDRFFALPFNRSFFNQTTSYFQKDDHDVLMDDCYPGTRYGTLTFERGVEMFDREQFPSNVLPYKTVRWGKNLQIWLVEGRNFRSANNMEDNSEKTIWGKEQKAWFYRTVTASDAELKILFSPTPILGPDRNDKFDSHANKNWQSEGDELRQFINQQKNLYIVCGDRHWQYVTHHEGTNLWEFCTGAGSDKHAGGWPEHDKRAEHRFLRVKGGFVKGTINTKVRQLRLSHHDVDGNEVHSETFKF
jgi:alkaline phosphatase D